MNLVSSIDVEQAKFASALYTDLQVVLDFHTVDFQLKRCESAV